MKIEGIKAVSGKEAIDRYKKEPVDMVFLDIRLNDMSGFEVLDQIQKINPLVKTIMITGKANADFEEKARGLGVLDYITKPLDLAELKSKLGKYLN